MNTFKKGCSIVLAIILFLFSPISLAEPLFKLSNIKYAEEFAEYDIKTFCKKTYEYVVLQHDISTDKLKKEAYLTIRELCDDYHRHEPFLTEKGEKNANAIAYLSYLYLEDQDKKKP